jgi:endonuclease/exonuclease/phosphatase family metal-dependent hydrolase
MRSSRFLVVATLFLATSCGSRAVERASELAATRPLTVMTFNIRYGTAPDGVHSWSERRGLTFKVIGDYDPDVLGVQEALRFQLDQIAEQLTLFGEVGVGRDDGIAAGEYAAILYDTARLFLLEHGTFWLSDEPSSAGSMTWGNRFPRIVTWARFRDRAADAPFYVYNTHWDHESQPSRERSAALLLERIRERRHGADPVSGHRDG